MSATPACGSREQAAGRQLRTRRRKSPAKSHGLARQAADQPTRGCALNTRSPGPTGCRYWKKGELPARGLKHVTHGSLEPRNVVAGHNNPALEDDRKQLTKPDAISKMSNACHEPATARS